jgi:23S rRNA pseudoU1915 N3-methylase RlmH
MMLTSVAKSITHAVSDVVDEVSNAIGERLECKRLKKELKAEVQRVCQEREQANSAHANEMKDMRQKIMLMKQRLDMALSKWYPLYLYACELRSVYTCNYVLVIQAQLCRQVHLMTACGKQLRLAKQTKARLTELVEEQEEKQLERIKNLVKEQDKLQQQVDGIEDTLEAKEPKDYADDSGVSEIDKIVRKLSQLSMELHNKRVEPQDFKPLDNSSMGLCKASGGRIQKQVPSIPTG